MEQIPNYDNWKTTEPEKAKPVVFCSMCGCPLYEGDTVYMIDGYLCEDCLNNNYKEILEVE